MISNNRKSAVLFVITLWLYAMIDFLQNTLETAFHTMLMVGNCNYSSLDWHINAQKCKSVLLIVAGLCLLSFLAHIIIEAKHRKML